jgi:hypothetical protein
MRVRNRALEKKPEIGSIVKRNLADISAATPQRHLYGSIILLLDN